MSDPLSVAGTAVGITSLGIQVCQGLFWYLRSVHGKRGEIARDLGEIQTLISIFYSLNDILPKINQTRCTEATTIRRCLEDSEGKLLELQQLLVKLRGPQESTANRDKMREAGRKLVYPFRADTLKSLRQSLRELLNNLNLAIDITSLASQVTNRDKIDSISLSIQNLDVQSKDSNAGIQDLNTKMQQNLSQFRSLESTIADSLTEFNQRISQVEWAIQDLSNDISGKLTITETEVVSTRRAMSEMLTDMAGKLDSQSAEISQLMFIDALASPDETYYSMHEFGVNLADPYEIEQILWRDNSVLATMLRILQVLHELVQTDDIEVAAWPEGLGMLLTTEARNLVHDDTGNPFYWPTALALRYECEKSLDMLMKAGFRFQLDRGWRNTSPGCAMVAARRLFERRAKLFELAQNQLQDFEGEYTCNTSEEEAECLYYRLVAAGIQVDPGLEVQHGCTTVFHCSNLPLDYFRIFFENGFRNNSAHDELGFTAAMVYRRNLFPEDMHGKVNIESCLSTLQWLQEKAFLDHSPEDPCNLGLNTNSTGWHYLAAHAYFEGRAKSIKMPLREVSRSSARDSCVCWCIPEGEGCSPLGCILKAHADSYCALARFSWKENLAELFEVSGCGDTTSTVMTQFVRFLTFEALEMTHTCCHFQILDQDTLEFVTFDECDPSFKQLVILDHDAKVIQKTRADRVEQKNAGLLDSLMEEFSVQLNVAEPTVENFVNFLKGDWRSRIERLFTVNEDIVNGMRESLSDVKTHVWPERVQCFVHFGDSESEDSCSRAESMCDTEYDSGDEMPQSEPSGSEEESEDGQEE
ncbi:Hypothetical protein NCS54_01221200 [Fusarium falciforme]|uniref:Hypothetical protein n=1 Tax=Fusarium falciforme TaxID=195108 RepID=UPI0023000DAB|nr:Hypothetical protein NCS54_01221200 [Fusarium falciforme]WAO94620.1 Hypothetical protein NCS54_01221200 [Fusarium falciforme]